MSDNRLVVRGAREHNLKGIDVEVPRDQLVVITGLSGSGKSSLAFDTIYAEGQRRYVESLSAYARQFLQQHQKPRVESVEGLSPAIAIEQKSTSRNPRSTVGTLTEIYDYLRLLYARVGQVACWRCGKPITAQTVQQIVDAILELPQGTRILVLAPFARGRKGAFRRELALLRKQAWPRVRVDGQVRLLSEDIELDKRRQHTVELVTDRMAVSPEIRQRLADAVEVALEKAEGLVGVAVAGGEELLFSERFACYDCGINMPELAPRMFSFNSPHGACPECDGLGFALEIDADKVIPDPSKTLAQGAIAAPGFSRNAAFNMQQLRALAEHYGASMDAPWAKLPARFRRVVLNGSDDERIAFVYETDKHSFSFDREYEGVLNNLARRFRETQSERGREELQSYMSRKPCRGCAGARLRPEALAVRVGGRSIREVCALGVGQLRAFFDELTLDVRQQCIAERPLKEIQERIAFLEAVGLEYLSLDRASTTLSGGEAQRIRLATQIGSALRGVIYVLDEPSIGLHQRDNDRLLATLRRLRDLGNTVLVVEHDAETILSADHVIDMGPGAGIHGGSVVAAGTPEEIQACPQSLTGQYLSGERRIDFCDEPRPGHGTFLHLRGARGNNLRGIDVKLPLGKLICVTGVSGSGKSTLVNDTLLLALTRQIHGSKVTPAAHDGLDGVEHLDHVIAIDQSPIGRTPRSNPATYTQLFAPLRDLFAGLPDSRARGYKPGRYSFNVKGGRCEACEGDGVIRIEMHFLPDVFVTCEQCNGRRYNRETLEIVYKTKSIADVLDMTVDEAHAFFRAIPVLKRKLDTLQAVGLGYIKLGQGATTLSGGEAQRIKLSRELSKRATGRTLYVLDEPTTGLHFQDVERLLRVLHTLVDSGNTVVVIEHNLDVIKTADHIIDLGPDGGTAGGTLVGAGPPAAICQLQHSHTGRYLARKLVS